MRQEDDPATVVSSQQLGKRFQPGRVRRPCGRRHEVAIDVRVVESVAGRHETAATRFDFGRDRRIGGATSALHNACRRQNLDTVTNRGDRLARHVKASHEFQHSLIQSQVFRCATSGNDQSLIIVASDGLEVACQPKAMPRLLTVRLVTLKVVDRRHDEVARLLVGTDRVDLVPQYLECLERDHRFVVFDEIANQ